VLAVEMKTAGRMTDYAGSFYVTMEWEIQKSKDFIQNHNEAIGCYSWEFDWKIGDLDLFCRVTL